MRLEAGVYIDDTTTGYRLNQSFTPSYTIWKDTNVAPTLIRAESNIAGTADISGTNAATVINAAIAALTAGTVYVRKSATDYSIDTALVMADRVDFIGEKDATLTASQNLTPGIIDLENAASTAMRLKIAGFRLEGDSVCNYGIVIEDSYDSIVLCDMEVLSCASMGIDIRGGVWGVHARDLMVTAPTGGYGLKLGRSGTASGASSLNTFDYVFIQGAGTGTYLYGDVIGNTFNHCHITAQTYGNHISGDGTYTPTLNKYVDCWFERGAQGTRAVQIDDAGVGATIPLQTSFTRCHFGNWLYGAYLAYGAKTSFNDCYFASIATQDIETAAGVTDTLIDGGVWNAGIVNGGTRTLTRGQGFTNRGTATIGNGTQTTGNVAHGLSVDAAVTPSTVFAFGSTTDTEDLYCSSKDATNIVIQTAAGAVGGDRTIYWEVNHVP